MFVYGSGWISKHVEDIRPGTLVSFGMYRLPCGHKPFQDKDPEMWMDIDWIVLEVVPSFSTSGSGNSPKGHKALMITRDCLDWDFFDCYGSSWSGSDLRRWMNTHMFERFYFPEDDKSAIMVRGEAEQDACGSCSSDRLFLLTADQVLHYFPEAKERRSEMHFADELKMPFPGKTPSSVSGNDPETYILKDEVSREPADWWTSTPWSLDMAKALYGLNDDEVEEYLERYDHTEESITTPKMFVVRHDGEFFEVCADADEIGIRPAVWVDLDKVKIKR